MTRWPIAPGEVHLWTLPAPPCDGVAGLDAWLPLLDAEEQARAGRFVFDRNRHEFIAAHALTRLMLAAFTGLPAASLTFATGPKGKPVLSPMPAGLDLHFNLSHTGGRVACGVAVGAGLGIDIEALDRRVNLDVADHYFAPHEVAWLHGLAPAHQGEGFLRLWTLKESWIKAIGEGLSQPLQDFGFAFDPFSVWFADSIGARPADWFFAGLPVGTGHLAAACLPWSGPGRPAVLVRHLATLDEAAAPRDDAVRLAMVCGAP